MKRNQVGAPDRQEIRRLVTSFGGVADGSRGRQGVAEELEGVEDLEPCKVANLHPAAFTVREDDIGLHLNDLLRQVLPDLFSNGVLLLLETVKTAQTAALRFDQADVESRDETEKFEGGEAAIE
jgi:hypothetical protein